MGHKPSELKVDILRCMRRRDRDFDVAAERVHGPAKARKNGLRVGGRGRDGLEEIPVGRQSQASRCAEIP